MVKKKALEETRQFVNHIKKCIAESDEIDPRYKDGIIQHLEDTADEILSKPKHELDAAIEKIKSLNLTKDEMEDLMAVMLTDSINNQIADYQAHEGDKHE